MINPSQTAEKMTASPQSSPEYRRNAAADGSFHPWVNVASHERWISGIGGGALAYGGMKRGGRGGLICMAVAGLLIRRATSGHCPAYSALGISTADASPVEPEQFSERGIHVDQSVTVDRSPNELYQFWKNFENLPKFMAHLKSVRTIDEVHSHWVAKGPVGLSVEWDAEIINDEAPTTIAWRSLRGAPVDSAGSVRFTEGPAGRGTEVRVIMNYIPPAGRFGQMVAKLFGEDPAAQVREDLRHFKQFIETGEVPTTQGQPAGR